MVYPQLVNFEAMLVDLDYEPIYLNDYNPHIDEERIALNNLMISRYGDKDTLSSVPSCACGELNGKDKEGQRCTSCGHVCDTVFMQNIEPVLWIRVPEGISYFVSPLVWKMLTNILKSGTNSILLWLTDPRYTPKKVNDNKMKKLEDLYTLIPGFRRGLNFFTENFDIIIKVLLDTRIVNQNAMVRSGLLRLYETDKDCFFTTVLPVPNRNTLIIEKHGTLVRTDTKSLSGIDAFLTLNGIDHDKLNSSIAVKESNTVACLDQLTKHYEKYVYSKLLVAKGEIRKHVVGSRLNFTARTVITSLHDIHHYQQIYIPWGVGIEVFKEHIRSKLLNKHGMAPMDIEDLLVKHVRRHHPLLEQVLDEIIEESPYTDIDGMKLGFPCCFQRNPSLLRGSALLLFIGRIKKDRDKYGNFIDNTISLSPLVVNSMNADYDGDELNLLLILDHEMYNQFTRLEPHLSALNLKVPWEMSDQVGMPSPQLATLGNFLHRSD